MESDNATKYIKLLELQTNQINSLTVESELSESEAFHEWKYTTKNLIYRIFGRESEEAKQFDHIHFYPQVLSSSTSQSYYAKYYIYGLRQVKSLLKGLIYQLQNLGLPSEKPLKENIANQININQAQNNTQTQQTTLNVDQKVDFTSILERFKSEESNEEKVKEAEIILHDLENELNKPNPAWSILSKGLQQILSFGKSIAIEVIAEVVKRMYLPTSS